MANAQQKLLVVADSGLTQNLAEYALNVAIRLDLEIIVLFLDQEHQRKNDREQRGLVRQLESRVERAAADFTSLAWKSSVNVTTVVDVDTRESAVSRLQEQDRSIRFILSNDALTDRAGEDAPNPRLTVIRTGEHSF